MSAIPAIPLEQQPIEYPTSDGKPMAETTLHRMVMSDLIEGLAAYYAAEPDVWVGGNLFLYYREQDPRSVVAPDVLLVKGVEKWNRPIYKLWEEGRPPSLIVEVTSKSTRDEDLDEKKGIYQHIGVEEYILFDPYGDYLKPRLQGYRLTERGYSALSLELDGSLLSRTTSLLLRPEAERLRLVEPATGRLLPWIQEAMLERTRKQG
ncbi:MAG TPA: Uma2 family endonuclease [Thermoanaerobaculia bacterium]|nr:Uma2 family endonuclease [Thermoanaerobaculia bacterium]